MDRVAELRAALLAAPWLAVATHHETWLTRGRCRGWLSVGTRETWAHPFVGLIGDVSAEHQLAELPADVSPSPLPAALADQVADRERRIDAQLGRLERGQAGYKMLQGDRLELSIDGRLYGVSPVSVPGAPLGLTPHVGGAVVMGVERDVFADDDTRAMVALPEGLYDRVAILCRSRDRSL